MTTRPASRLLRVGGWLLTPFVVWAASFLGGWLGAIVGRRLGTLGGGIGWLVAFDLIAAVLALWGWVRLLRRVPAPSGPPDSSGPTTENG